MMTTAAYYKYDGQQISLQNYHTMTVAKGHQVTRSATYQMFVI